MSRTARRRELGAGVDCLVVPTGNHNSRRVQAWGVAGFSASNAVNDHSIHLATTTRHCHPVRGPLFARRGNLLRGSCGGVVVRKSEGTSAAKAARKSARLISWLIATTRKAPHGNATAHLRGTGASDVAIPSEILLPKARCKLQTLRPVPPRPPRAPPTPPPSRFLPSATLRMSAA